MQISEIIKNPIIYRALGLVRIVWPLIINAGLYTIAPLTKNQDLINLASNPTFLLANMLLAWLNFQVNKKNEPH